MGNLVSGFFGFIGGVCVGAIAIAAYIAYESDENGVFAMITDDNGNTKIVTNPPELFNVNFVDKE